MATRLVSFRITGAKIDEPPRAAGVCAGMLVTVFGGSGFLGRRIVNRLAREGMRVRVAARHPERAGIDAGAATVQASSVAADIRDDDTVHAAVAGADAVVNAVSAYTTRRLS